MLAPKTIDRGNLPQSRCSGLSRCIAPLLAVIVAGCAGGAAVSTTGSGGQSTSGTGGAIGSGGSPSGGATATGGASSSGGNGTGGNTNSGGSSTGGASTGGAIGSGGNGGNGLATGGRGGGNAATGGASGGAGGRVDAGVPDGGSKDAGTGGGAVDAGGGVDAGGVVDSGGSAFNPCPAAGTACAILPLGDSITEGYASSHGAGYRYELFRQAVLNNKTITFVGNLMNGPASVENKTFPKRHEGHGGFTIAGGGTSSGIAGSITQNALSTYKPHVVLLMIGTNDLNGNIDVSNAPTRLEALADDIISRSPTSLLVLASIMPINGGNASKVPPYNTAIRTMVDKKVSAGKHVVFVDNYTVITKMANYTSALMSDYLHPNDAGYAVLGKSFYDALSALLR